VGVDLRIFTEPQQGASYTDLLAMALTAESLGFSGFFRSDHYMRIGNGSGLPGPTDAWVTLSGLARETHTIRLGTLVSSATFRLPGPLAITVAQVDQMSGGRVEFGLGAGWFEGEHTAYAIPFPPIGERFERLREQLQIITGLWSTPVGSVFDFDGYHYRLLGAPALPKPVQAQIPIIIGGGGKHRTPRLAALFASEYNLAFRSITTFREQRDRVRAACDVIGRDPESLTFSVALTVCCGERAADFKRRARVLGREPEELREVGAAGLPRQVAETLRAWRDAGASRIYLQMPDVHDLDQLHVIAEQVKPLLR
jgi:F420-dependent oxidoreductase-like protein